MVLRSDCYASRQKVIPPSGHPALPVTARLLWDCTQRNRDYLFPRFVFLAIVRSLLVASYTTITLSVSLCLCTSLYVQSLSSLCVVSVLSLCCPVSVSVLSVIQCQREEGTCQTEGGMCGMSWNMLERSDPSSHRLPLGYFR